LYNEARLAMYVKEEMVHKLVRCRNHGTTSLLVGLDQVQSDDLCYDCLLVKDHKKELKERKMDAWGRVRPETDQFPKRIELGHTDEDLPDLFPGKKAVIALFRRVLTNLCIFTICLQVTKQ
jgi:hypothetical protein